MYFNLITMKFFIKLPPEVQEHIPEGCNIDLKTYLIMEYVAKAVLKEGNPFEFRLKIHPYSNKLPFLDSNNQLHNFYQFLQKYPEYHLYNYSKDQVPEQLHELYERVFGDEIKDCKNVKEKSENGINLVEGYSDSD